MGVYMLKAMHAYIGSQGKIEYRTCQIGYYTYSMFESPNKFRVNVNVHMPSASKDITIKSLTINNDFDKENEAIDFGINKGKEYIDKNYPHTSPKQTTNKKHS